MTKKLSVQVGQEVWVKPMGNAARRYKDPIPGKVEHVGTKYFTVRFQGALGGARRFHLSNALEDTNYTADWKIYLDKQEIDDERFQEILLKNIRVDIVYPSKPLSLSALKAIREIIDNDKRGA